MKTPAITVKLVDLPRKDRVIAITTLKEVFRD